MLDWVLLHAGFLSFNQQISNVCLRLLNLYFDIVSRKKGILHQLSFCQRLCENGVEWVCMRALEAPPLVFMYPCSYINCLTARPSSLSLLQAFDSVSPTSLVHQAVRFCVVKQNILVTALVCRNYLKSNIRRCM